MAKEKSEGFKALLKPSTWAPSPGLVARIGVGLVIWRVFTRYIIVPNQAKLPAVVRDNWPTPA